MQQTRTAPPATLDAVLERITYANQETGYTVARVATQTDWQAANKSRSRAALAGQVDGKPMFLY